MYHCTCNECFYEWFTDEEYSVYSFCPKCLQGDINYELNAEYTPQTAKNTPFFDEKGWGNINTLEQQKMQNKAN